MTAPVRWALPYPLADQPAQGYPLLEGVEHQLIYLADKAGGWYSHHAHLAKVNGALLVTWSCHATDEDAAGQRVLFSRSTDGQTWSRAVECFPSCGPVAAAPASGRVLTANGFPVIDGLAYAIAEVDDQFAAEDTDLKAARESEAGRKTYRGRLGWGRIARSVAADGTLGPIFWLTDEPPEPWGPEPSWPSSTDPQVRDIAAKLVAYQANPVHMGAWDFKHHTCWETAADGHEMCEPTVFPRDDGALVKLARDKSGSRRMYASVSNDRGEAWTQPLQTNLPDSPSKAVAGRLPDGRTYLIGNQTRGRDPLVIALSSDGVTFDQAAAIRAGAPAVRQKGRAKGRGYQYPSALVDGETLWVVYSIGKEDVAISRVPLVGLPAS